MIIKALESGKHVVTANKEVIAKDIDTLLNIANEHQVQIAYEASVGGGIPIIKNIKVLKVCLILDLIIPCLHK